MKTGKRIRILEKLVYLLLPLILTVAIVLLPFVNSDLTFTWSVKYIGNSILTAIVLLSYYFCFRTLFNGMYLNSKRIRDKSKEYSVRSTLIYSGHLSKFDEFSDYEYNLRRTKFINRNLQTVPFGYDEFIDRYKFSCKNIRKDSTLSRNQKHLLIMLTLKLKFIKRQDYEKVLPGTECGTVYRRVKSSMDRMSKLTTTKKVFTTTLLSILTVAYWFTLADDLTIERLIAEILLRVIASMLQILSALFSAKRIVNKSYFSELSEKILYMNEYIEWDNLSSELTNYENKFSNNDDI